MPPYWLPEKPYVDQEATVSARHGTTDWFKPEKTWERSMSRLYIITLLI